VLLLAQLSDSLYDICHKKGNNRYWPDFGLDRSIKKSIIPELDRKHLESPGSNNN